MNSNGIGRGMRHALGAVGLASVTMLGACAPISPAFDSQFGRSVPELRAAQVANPQATLQNRDRAVTGMDGRAAREATERYYRSFREPPPPGNTFVIGVGGGEGNGMR
jgi:hypothetical protein